MKKIFLTTSIYILSFVFCILHFDNAKAQMHFTNYASKNEIYAIAEQGNYIWVGTSGGLVKRNKSTGSVAFNYTQENSNLPSNYIMTLAVDANGG
jgi:ligand-binding sensor domain-containing protein